MQSVLDKFPGVEFKWRKGASFDIPGFKSVEDSIYHYEFDGTVAEAIQGIVDAGEVYVDCYAFMFLVLVANTVPHDEQCPVLDQNAVIGL
jgi:hypothetical protein